MQVVGADGSTPCGSGPLTPWMELPKWKLVILRVNYRPKVRDFWVFQYTKGDLATQVGVGPQKGVGGSGPAVNVRPMSDIPCGM
jgi:hypothetical protein